MGFVSTCLCLNVVEERSNFKGNIVLKLLNYIIKYNYEIINCFEDCVDCDCELYIYLAYLTKLIKSLRLLNSSLTLMLGKI